MISHLKYFLSPFFLLLSIIAILYGNYFPCCVFIGFNSLVVFGDLIFKQDKNIINKPNQTLLNLALYINLPLLYVLISIALFVLTNSDNNWYISLWSLFNVDILFLASRISSFDYYILLLLLIPLFIATMGTNVGHELIHRKNKKFDMFVGNWLLALSWDCTFAIEHVYGHHKNIGLKNDPATAKREESLYLFIFKSIIKTHIDAWKIEINRLNRINKNPYFIKNKMFQGYMRSFSICLIAYLIGSYIGLFIFIYWSIIAKSFLEAINFIEHYGLVRIPGKPVMPRHSWNSNHIISSAILYNLNRHSSHHEKSNLKYWELKSYPNAPILPYGYLQCLYLVYFCPILFKRIMRDKLKEWDNNYASKEERKLFI